MRRLGCSDSSSRSGKGRLGQVRSGQIRLDVKKMTTRLPKVASSTSCVTVCSLFSFRVVIPFFFKRDNEEKFISMMRSRQQQERLHMRSGLSSGGGGGGGGGAGCAGADAGASATGKRNSARSSSMGMGMGRAASVRAKKAAAAKVTEVVGMTAQVLYTIAEQ